MGESSRADLIAPGGKIDEDLVRSLVAEGDTGEDEALRRVQFKLTRDLRKRLDQYLTDRIGFLSRAQAQRLIDSEMVQVNGRTPKASTKLRLGDVVDVVVPPPPSKEIKPERIPIQVLFEDEHLIVLNKTPDIIVHPARSHLSGTLVNALAWHFQNNSPSGGGLSEVGADDARPGVIHRLDRQTSGVLVFAKHEETHWKIARQFEHRTVDKRYLAVVTGALDPLAEVIDLPIGPHPSNVKGQREKYVVRYDDWGKPSVTIYRTRERYEGYTLVEIELRTGRTHQIRVHMSHRGHPLVGDDMYGGPLLTYGHLGAESPNGPGADLMTRQALHAASLTFRHPMTGERMTFTAPVPLDMARLIAILRKHRPGAGPTDFESNTLDLSRAVPDVELP
ncbi:MAG: RluA family pseudouridine synthase [Planctomycetota bacterium]|nr:RluA family pseudouridine synthase [Planctomycetota bacterium]